MARLSYSTAARGVPEMLTDSIHLLLLKQSQCRGTGVFSWAQMQQPSVSLILTHIGAPEILQKMKLMFGNQNSQITKGIRGSTGKTKNVLCVLSLWVIHTWREKHIYPGATKNNILPCGIIKMFAPFRLTLHSTLCKENATLDFSLISSAHLCESQPWPLLSYGKCNSTPGDLGAVGQGLCRI